MTIESGPGNWIESAGGPLMLLAEQNAEDWGGIFRPSGSRVAEADFRWGEPGAPAADYDRACDVRDYVGRIQVGPVWALVFGDAPMPTMWQGNGSSDGGMFVRWNYADDEKIVLDSLQRIPESDWVLETFDFQVDKAPHILFDSALSGTMAIKNREYLRIELAPGRYTVATNEFKPDEYISLCLHRLTRIR